MSACGTKVGSSTSRHPELAAASGRIRARERRAKDEAALKPDYGADLGQAATSRPNVFDRGEGLWRGQIASGQVDVRRYQDSHLIDRMNYCGQLNDRCYDAANIVLEKYSAAGFEQKTVASYGPHGWNRGHDDDTEESTAITEFRSLLGGCPPFTAWLLHGMALGQHPGSNLRVLQEALVTLADWWGVEKDC